MYTGFAEDGTVLKNTVTYTPIGIIETEFEDPVNMPIQPSGAEGVPGKVILEKKYAEGLKDLEGFSHIMLVYHFHKCSNVRLRAQPFLENTEHGIFATRGPSRPNPVGLSVVRLESIEDNVLHITNADMLNGTPLLDIKPYVREFDNAEDSRIGWLEQRVRRARSHRSDGRFL